MARTTRLTLTLVVDYDLPDGEDVVTVHNSASALLRRMVDREVNNGGLTGDSPLTVSSWSARINSERRKEDE